MYAWVTSVVVEGEVERARILGGSLLRVKTGLEKVVLVSSRISKEGRASLEKVFDLVLNIPNHDLDEKGLQKLAKIWGWSLLIFDKCVYIAPNAMVIKNCDNIFDNYGAFAMSRGYQNKGDLSVFVFTPERNIFEKLKNLLPTPAGEGDKDIVEFVKTLKNVEVLDEAYKWDVGFKTGAAMTPSSMLDSSILKFTDDNHPAEAGLPSWDHDSLGFIQKFASQVYESVSKGFLESNSIHSRSLYPKHQEPIAIVGMGFRLPGANNVEEFWDLLVEGKDAIQRPPSHRWTRERSLYIWKNDQVKAGFLSCPVDEFDSKFFGVSPKEAVELDPQQRFLHEISWEALEDAGINPRSIYGTRTAFFVGSWVYNYKDISAKNVNYEFLRTYMGNSIAASSARLSHFFGCTGPSIATESGCSSAIVAVDMACKALLNRETPLALAAGVNLLIHPFSKKFAESVLSPNYRCSTFDAGADGFARAEGCGVLVLKRLSDAVKDGDRVWGLIRGTGIAQEGLSKSLGTPTVHSESLAMKLALKTAGVLPEEVSYIETHGTGTPVGDPLEVAAINAAYYSEGRNEPLIIGSVKTNVGHTEALSGITGIIKVLLSMKHEKIPKHLHLKTLNPNLNLDKVPLKIPTENLAWEKLPYKRRLAGVSSFGISGTDGHAIIEEAPEDENIPLKYSMTRPLHILKISAKSPESFDKLVEEYGKKVGEAKERFEDIAFSANTGRATFQHRGVVIASNSQDAEKYLRQKTFPQGDVQADSGSLCFLFSGQGSQYPGMARELYDTSPVFRYNFNRCDNILKKKYNISIKDAMWGENATVETMSRTLHSQISIFCVEYCLLQLWLSWGVKPDYVMGHSLGEFAAAVAAKILDFEDALMLVAERSRLIDNLPQGKMLVIKASQKVVQQAVEKYKENNPGFWMDVAALNSPDQTVLAGDSKNIEDFSQYCKGISIKSLVLASTHAFHSKHMDPMLEEYRKVASSVKLLEMEESSPKYISGMEGKLISGEEINSDYWVRHTRDKVSFIEASKAVLNDGCTLFLEIGPQPILSAMVMTTLDGQEVSCLPSIRRNEGNWTTLLETVGKLYLSSWKGEVDWKGFDRSYARNKVDLSFYPFNRKSIWLDTRPSPPELHPLVGRHLPTASTDFICEKEMTLKNINFAKDHVIGNTVVFPGAGFLEMCLAAGHAASQGLTEEIPKPRRGIAIKDLKIVTPLAIYDSPSSILQTSVKLEESPEESEEGYMVTIHRHDGVELASGGQWISHANAKYIPVLQTSQEDRILHDFDISTAKETWKFSDNQTFYEKLPEVGLRFGPDFQSLESCWKGDSGILLKVKVPEDSEDYLIHPIVADAMIQAFMLSGWDNQNVKRNLQVPISIGKFTWFSWSEDKERYIFCARGTTEDLTCTLINSKGTTLATMSNVEFATTTVKLVEGMIQQQCVAMPKLWQEIWKPAPGPNQNKLILDGSTLTPDSSMLKTLASFNKASNEEEAFYQNLCLSCRLFFLRALYKSGWKPEISKVFTTEELILSSNINMEFTQFAQYFLRSLAQENMLEMEEGINRKNKFWFTKLPPSETDIQTFLHKPMWLSHSAREEYRLIFEVGKVLHEILQGKLDPLSVLFPEDSSKPSAKLLYEAVSPWTSSLVDYIATQKLIPLYNRLSEGFTAQNLPGKPVIRVLEVGSGTGVYSQGIINCFERNKVDYEFYFTDISTSFFPAAQVIFEKQKERFIYKKLDMEQDPLEQGLYPEYFDTIMGCEVFHVAKDIKKTLRNLRPLLKPNGIMEIIETTNQDPRITFIFGLLDGYWQFEDFDFRPYHTTLTPEMWKTALESSGFNQVSCSPSYMNVHGFITANADPSASLTLSQVRKPSHSWIIFGDGGAFAKEMKEKLERVNRNVFVVEKPDINKESEKVVKELMQNAITSASREGTLEGSLYLWGLSSEDREQVQISLPFVTLCQLLTGMNSPPNVFVVTQGVCPAEASQVYEPSPATLLGIIKAMHNEHTEVNINHLDLSPSETVESQIDEIFYNLWNSNRNIFAFRSGKRYHPKIAAVKLPNDYLSLPNGCDRFQLELPTSKQIADLEFTFLDHYHLAEDEVEIEVKAIALNFRDVFTVLKPITEFDTFHAVGLDFAGVVTKVGPSVRERKVGDRVVGMRMDRDYPLPSHVKTKELLAFSLPQKMTFAEGATIPTVLATNIFALVMVSKMKKGETILIHTASGGVGLCAIQLAKLIDVKVIATAGNERKRTVLRNLGVEHVFNSRSTEFGEQVLNVTNGRGVDIILNSLTGPGFKEASLGALARNGRFVELSVLNIWTEEDVAVTRPDVFYKAINLTLLSREELQQVGDGISYYLGEGLIHPIPHERFDALNIRGALGYLQKAKHIGKIVCMMPEVKADKRKYFSRTPLCNPNSTYLVTGGLGGIGWEVVKWILGSGGKHVAIASRSNPKPEIASQIEAWNKAGMHVEAFSVDIGNLEDCRHLFSSIETEFPPLRGIMHAAGVLADATVENQSWDKFLHTYNPKISGSWNLHDLSVNMNLEFFVLFSSFSATFGSPGQTNHSSSNSFEDTLAFHRHSIGLPATTVNWGNWGEVGVATEIDFAGLRPISTSQGFLALEMFLRTQTKSIAVINVESFAILSKLFPSLKTVLDDKRLMGDQRQSHIFNRHEFWMEVDKAEGLEQKLMIFTEFVKTSVKNLIKSDPDEVIDDNAEFSSIGVDSLTMLEMKNGLQHTFGSRITLTAAHLKDCNTPGLLASKLVSLLEGDELQVEPTLAELKELIREDSILPEDIRPQENSLPLKKITDVETVLLTGVTGNLGPYLLRELSQNPQIKKIFCLIRKTNQDPSSRLERRLQAVHLLDQVDMTKVHCFQGDIACPKFGLSSEEYSQLAEQVDAIIHSGVKADHMEKYWKAPETRKNHIRTVNVGGTRRILEFSVEHHLKHVYHASTMYSIVEVDSQGCLSETWQDVGAFDDFPMNAGYAFSKHVSEQLIQQGVERGMPCKVFRLPLIAGESTFGTCDFQSTHILLRLLAFLKLGVVPDLPCPLPMIPVDICARDSLHVFFHPGAASDVYTMVNNNPDVEQVIISVAQEEFGISIQPVSYTEFAEMLKQEPENSPLAPFKELYEDNDFVKISGYGTINVIQKYLENSECFYQAEKMSTIIPRYKEGLEQSHQVIRRDLHFLKKKGVFKTFGISSHN